MLFAYMFVEGSLLPGLYCTISDVVPSLVHPRLAVLLPLATPVPGILCSLITSAAVIVKHHRFGSSTCIAARAVMPCMPDKTGLTNSNQDRLICPLCGHGLAVQLHIKDLETS